MLLGLLALPIAVSAQATPGVANTAGNQASPTSSIANNICKGILSTETGTISPSTTADSCAESGDRSFTGLAKRIINVFSIVVGAVSVIMIIIGGFRYIISGGDSTGVTSAKNTILYAIVGLVIVLFSQVIIRFVISNVGT